MSCQSIGDAVLIVLTCSTPGEKDVASLRSALAKMKGPEKVKIFRKGSFSILTLNPVN
jgi:hypothetical protein